jgi:uncharacterized SAM-binding protein YcdF (DUF218 family)
MAVKMKRRRLLKILFAASLLLVLLTVLIAWLFPQRLLAVDSGPVKADAIVVLGGNFRGRPERAVELFKQGEAPGILISGKGDEQTYKTILINSGVPARNISMETKSNTTRENAEFSIPLLRQMDAHRVIIVTSWYHSRRALMCFEHYAPDIQFYSRPSYFGYLQAEWPSDNVGRKIKSEYLKLIGYWVRYGVCPI